ncbi:hypothetical protein MHU86_7201 [Fragilaria crotonensis]|nr:hypothetical protein MHU86_7201 [Fragilaria crotonensis]
MKTLATYYQCWLEITKQQRYRDKWLSDELYFRAINAQFPTLKALGFDRGMLNKAISSCEGATLDDFTELNDTGRFRRSAKGLDIFGNPKRKIWGYYVTDPGGLVERPPDGKKCFLSLLQDAGINDRYSVARGSSEIVDLTTEIHIQSRAKRKAEAGAAVAAQSPGSQKKAKASQLASGSDSAIISVESYWDSPEAKKLFLGSSTDNRSVVDVLQQRIERLQQVNRSPDGWRDLIDKHDVDNLCSPYDIFIIRQRCSILCLAYIMALEEMNSARWVEDCCSQAVYDSNRMGIEAATSKLTVNDDDTEENATNENGESSTTIKDCCPLLQTYLDSPISLTTTWRWLRRLGFHYDSRKKSFFVDGHERPNVVFHRNEFCTKYLSKLEPRTHRWIQVRRETVEKWKSEKRISDDVGGQGYSYQEQPSGKEMIEFHVDDFDFLHSVAEEMGFGMFGGNLSVRKPLGLKPLMIFGQDESVFNQFLLKSRQWVGPLGQRPLLPKTDGMSLMLSAIQSRETGFGVPISRIQMEEINETRRGHNYVDLDAAIAVHGQVSKKDLEESPFVGHSKKLTGGLDAYSMNRSYGGAQPIMRESKIKEHDGYLGMHAARTLNVGDTQSFVFTSEDDGPFWMSPQERELNRDDRILPSPAGIPRMRNKTIAELKSELAPLNILSNRRQYRLTELQQIARDNNLDPKVERTREKKVG